MSFALEVAWMVVAALALLVAGDLTYKVVEHVLLTAERVRAAEAAATRNWLLMVRRSAVAHGRP